jgi:isoquinoline 1-oxidoreductase beta subunit
VIVDRCSRLAPWRGVATSYTRFANESFIDELAHTLGADPLEFRIDLARDNAEGRAVLEEVGRMANWSAPREGRWLGVALTDYGASSVSAGIAEISVDETTGVIRVHRFWMAIDAGFILSPRNTEAQMEGTIIYGLSNALKERITVNGGVVEQSNFYDYQVMRMNEVPEVEVRALTNTRPPSGIGELGLATTGAAVANALYAATGVRMRELPMTPDRVLAALAARGPGMSAA